MPDLPTCTYVESTLSFPNPERGFHSGVYYESTNLDARLKSSTVIKNRLANNQTLYQHCYYLADYMESDIPQEYFDRMDANFAALREGGAKAIIRFAYKYDESESGKPYDASPEWMHRHIDQLAPVLQRNADVIFCFDAGFIGVWGEWGYTSYFCTDKAWEKNWEAFWDILNHMLRVFPQDRQIAVRTPGYKMRYLEDMGLDIVPLDESTAHNGSNASRISGHNDCFLSSADDWGTYVGNGDRAFWYQDTRYTNMGGEICVECAFSDEENAIREMENFHWTYLNYWNTEKWQEIGCYNTIANRLGYRLVLENAYISKTPQAGKDFQIRLTMHNAGFSAPQNPRDVELIFVQDSTKYVYKQDVDPRFWIPEKQSFEVKLTCHLDEDMAGSYQVYLNLPDPYPSIHDDPHFSIRLANKNVWDKATGYNKLAVVNIRKL